VNHYASSAFWRRYEALPERIQTLADKNFALLQTDPDHPSLRFKRVGRFWSARVGRDYRAVALPVEDGMLWFWIGTHAEYDRLLG
jgi:hypothetical protein